MNKLWRPTLTTKEATAICASLSNPSKMPGHGYALPAHRCRIGSLLQLLPKAICHYCYALRGRYLFPRVKAAMEKRFSSLSDPRWSDAVSTLIYRSKDRYFRWHDSGDLKDFEHLRQIVQVCRNLPRVKFWLPTRSIKRSKPIEEWVAKFHRISVFATRHTWWTVRGHCTTDCRRVRFSPQKPLSLRK